MAGYGIFRLNRSEDRLSAFVSRSRYSGITLDPACFRGLNYFLKRELAGHTCPVGSTET